MNTPLCKTDRLPPHSQAGELGILACCLLDPADCVGLTVEKFGGNAEIFYDLRHRVIFQSMLEMHLQTEAIDVITLMQHLKDKGELEQVGGMTFLATLPDQSPSSENIKEYLEIVHEKHLLRKMVQTCSDIVSKIHDYEGDVDKLMDDCEREVLAVRQLRVSERNITVKELVRGAIAKLEVCWTRQGAIGGIPTGLSDLDRLTDGLHPEEMIIIAGFPGSGKTSLAMNIAENAAINLKLPVGIFSMEMSAESLVTRFLCSSARVNGREIKDGFMTERDLPRLTNASGKIARSPLYFDENSSSVFQLCAKARRMWQQYGIKLFIIDYIQLLNASGLGKKTDNRQQEVADISRNIKCLAKEIGVPIIALSQLNDDGKLRESRAIGQDADAIWILKKEDEKQVSQEADSIFLDVVKHRNGPCGRVPLTFLKPYVRFESASKVSDCDVP